MKPTRLVHMKKGKRDALPLFHMYQRRDGDGVGGKTNMMAFAETTAALLLTPFCLAAGWLDLRYRRIPNWLCAATVLAAIPATLWGASPADAGSHALHALAALLVGMVLFRLGMFGGGDAKFYAAIAAWFPLGKAVLLLVTVAMCGLILLIVWFVYRRFRGIPVRKSNGSAFDGLPYGIAVGTGAVAAILI